jgi:hypothetical protein
MKNEIKENVGLIIFSLGLAIIACTPIAGWITHVITSIQHEQWLLLIIGTLLFPIGIIHGVGIWFGIFA